jgi:hypothetical protein
MMVTTHLRIVDGLREANSNPINLGSQKVATWQYYWNTKKDFGTIAILDCGRRIMHKFLNQIRLLKLFWRFFPVVVIPCRLLE